VLSRLSEVRAVTLLLQQRQQRRERRPNASTTRDRPPRVGRMFSARRSTLRDAHAASLR